MEQNEVPKIVVLINQRGIDTVGLVASTYEKEQEILDIYTKIRAEIQKFGEEIHRQLVEQS